MKPLFDIFQCRIWLQKIGKCDNSSSAASTICESETSSVRRQEEADEWKEKRKLIMKFPIPDRKEDYPVGPPNSPTNSFEGIDETSFDFIEESDFQLPESQS